LLKIFLNYFIINVAVEIFNFHFSREIRFYDRSIAHSVVHGGAEQDALSSEVSAFGAEERAILVQEPQGQE